MAQFDVYPNPNAAYRDAWPWVVEVQHALLDSLQTRFCIPLAVLKPSNSHLPKRLFPAVQLNGASYILLSAFAAPIHAGRLKKSQGNLAAHQAEIQAGLDAVVAGV